MIEFLEKIRQELVINDNLYCTNSEEEANKMDKNKVWKSNNSRIIKELEKKIKKAKNNI